jgi:hypothetical protein
MADYSFVKDSGGKINGIWLKDPTALNKPGMVEGVLMQEGSYLLNDYIAKTYRQVPNNVDSNGGCFVMFGGTKAPGESAVNKCSRCNLEIGVLDMKTGKRLLGGLADFYYGKKVIIKEFNTPYWKDSSKYIHTTEYEVRDIHHNCDYILCNRCVKKYNNRFALKLALPGIVVFITYLLIGIYLVDPVFGSDTLNTIAGIGVTFSAGYLFIVLIIWLITLRAKPKHQRSDVAIRLYSSKFKKAGYNHFYTPNAYQKFLKEVEEFKKIKI